MSDTSFDVAISGGGFVGLSLARALSFAASGGLRICVIDKTPHPAAALIKPNGRAFAISASSRRMLEALGVWRLVEHAAQPVAAFDITDSAFESFVRPVLLKIEDEAAPGEPPAHIVENHDLLMALAGAVQADTAITVLAPRNVTGFTCDDSVVSIDLAGEAAITASLLVAADGRRSPLRNIAGIKTVRWSYPQVGIVTTIRHQKPHHGRAVQHFLPSGPVAKLPLKGNRCSIVWTEKAEEGRAIMQCDDGTFLKELGKRFGAELGAITLEGPRQAYPLDFHIARRYVAARLALVGDTAHGVHPIAGLGFNLGLRDAAALAEVIIDARRLGMDIGSETVLGRYERWRRFDNASLALVMDGLNKLFSSDSGALRTVRDIGVGIVDRLPGVKRFLVREAAGFSGHVPRLLKGEPV